MAKSDVSVLNLIHVIKHKKLIYADLCCTTEVYYICLYFCP